MLDTKDIELLKKAKEDGQSLDEIIKGAEKIVALNELKRNLETIGREISYKYNQVIRNNIEKIAKLETDEEKLDFVIKESYNLYKKEQEEREKEELERQEAEKKMEEEIKNIEENQKN